MSRLQKWFDWQQYFLGSLLISEVKVEAMVLTSCGDSWFMLYDKSGTLERLMDKQWYHMILLHIYVRWYANNKLLLIDIVNDFVWIYHWYWKCACEMRMRCIETSYWGPIPSYSSWAQRHVDDSSCFFFLFNGRSWSPPIKDVRKEGQSLLQLTRPPKSKAFAWWFVS